MLTSQLTGFVAGRSTAPIEPTYWNTLNEFLAHAALITLSVTVTGLLIAGVIHLAMVGFLDRADRRSVGPAVPSEPGKHERPIQPSHVKTHPDSQHPH